MQEWFFATHRLNIPPAEFEEMDWREYDRRVWHYHFEKDSLRETVRDLQMQVHNLTAKRAIPPHKLFPLRTDRFNDYVQLQQPKAQLQAQKSHWQQMVEQGLITN